MTPRAQPFQASIREGRPGIRAAVIGASLLVHAAVALVASRPAPPRPPPLPAAIEVAFVKPPHPREFGGAEVVADDIAQVAPAEPRVQAEPRRLALRDRARVRQTVLLRPVERRFRFAQLHAATHRPHSEHHRQPGPRGPLFAEVVGEPVAGQARPHRAVADEQHRVRVQVVGGSVDGQGAHVGRYAVPLP